MLEDAGVVTVPVTLVLLTFCAVKAASSGLEITQLCMPVVSQPRSEVLPETIVPGFATRMMEGIATRMEHCAPAVCAPCVQIREYVAVLAPCGGAATVAVVVPEEPLAVNPWALAAPCAHE